VTEQRHCGSYRPHDSHTFNLLAPPWSVDCPGEPEPTPVDAHAYVVGMEGAGCVNPTHSGCPTLARPMPTQGQVEEAVTKAWAAPDASLTSIIAAVEALIRGES
jgi:hypothetical protein